MISGHTAALIVSEHLPYITAWNEKYAEQGTANNCSITFTRI